MSSRLGKDRCYFCPQTHNLETHHIVPQRKNGSDARENLVVVCERCHKKLETLYDKRFYERLGLSDDRGDRRSHFACARGRCGSKGRVKLENGYTVSDWLCPRHAAESVAGGSTVADSIGGGGEETRRIAFQITQSRMSFIGGGDD